MLSNTIFSIQNDQDFESAALAVFRHQYTHNPIYQRFCNLLGIPKTAVTTVAAIPYLPIQFFKTHTLLSTHAPVQQVFTSSGTTGSQVSKHYVTDLSIYEQSFSNTFQHFYGAITDYVILALLPSYLEREGSSLVYMAQQLITDSKHPDSGFYLHDTQALVQKLAQLATTDKKILLIGVSFALVDLVQRYTLDANPNLIVMETGGMKGRKKEIIRTELHDILASGFGNTHIHSEYGMTELLSQAYSLGNGIFKTPPWMKITTRDPEDALSPTPIGKTGGINIIDLANINSCAFIATQDLGKIHPTGDFEILGRFDHSDIRGCNLMALS